MPSASQGDRGARPAGKELTVKWLPVRHPGEAGHRKRNLELLSAAKNYVLKSCYKPKCRERRGRLGSPGQEVARGREQTGTRGEARLPAPGPRPRAQALFCLSSLTCKMGRRWPLQRRRCPKAMPRVWPFYLQILVQDGSVSAKGRLLRSGRPLAQGPGHHQPCPGPPARAELVLLGTGLGAASSPWG